MGDLKKEIADLVREVARVDASIEVGYQRTFRDMGVDSLETFNVFLRLSEEYGVEFPEEELERLTTIEKIAAFVESRRKTA